MTERAGDPGEREREEEEQEDEDGVVGWQCVCHVRARTTIRQIYINCTIPSPVPLYPPFAPGLGMHENGSSYGEWV